MKRKIVVALFLVLTLTCSLFTLTSCGNKDNSGNNTNGEKQVPVYQGMTITNNNTTISLASASYRSGGIMLLSANSENNGNNGNHNGQYKGDHAGKNEEIDEENPYPENDANENIEEEIKSSLNVIGSPDTIYYAEPNQDIYINIHIDNPDNFEILSFSLNGKKYSSYMFEDGSDMETIVLKYNVGAASGIVEYTIDAIKYIDGTEIKDVVIDGNKTVKAGVKTDNQLSASISGVDIDTNALSFNANISDNDNLIAFSNGALKAVIYDGAEIVAQKDLTVGENIITFDNLKTNTLYQYAIVGYYDDLSGEGFGMNVIYKDASYTDSVVLFDNISVGQESVSFSYLWHEDHQGKAISALKLYKGDNFIKDLATTATTVNELLSNATYKLVAEYPNGNNTESIYIEFTTLSKAVPNITINSATEKNAIHVEISNNDTDKTLIEVEATVLLDGTIVKTQKVTEIFTVEELLYSTNYSVYITAYYDLNDGAGVRSKEFYSTVTTLNYVDEQGVSYKVSQDGTATVVELSEKHMTNIIIPEEVIGYNVTSIGDCAFKDCTNLVSVIIPDTVETIGYNAFNGCSALKTLIIGNGVTTLCGGLLSGCSNLENLTIPFVGGSKSATSASSSTLFGYIFGTSSYTGGVAIEQHCNSSSYAMYYIPSSLESVTVTGGNILYGAFRDCYSLTSVTIGNSVTSIGHTAFFCCESLTSVTIGNGVTSIGNGAFSNC